MSKSTVIEIFLTKEDEKQLSLIFKNYFPDIYFLDMHAWSTPSPVLKNSIDQCYDKLNSNCAILNTKILPLDEYKDKFIAKIPTREEYHGADFGKGLIQVLHSKAIDYQPGSLKNGTMSFPLEDSATNEFAKTILKLTKKYCKKLKPFDKETGNIIEQRLARGFYGGLDAIEKYDQVNGLYLLNNTYAFFTSKF